MKRNLSQWFLGVAMLGSVVAAQGADLYQAQQLVQSAVQEAAQITAGGGGNLWTAQNSLSQVPYLISDLQRTPAVQQIDVYLNQALRTLQGNASVYDKARVVQNNGNEIIRLMDVLIRDGRGGGDYPNNPYPPNDPYDPGNGYGRSIRDTLGMMNQVESLVSYRSYNQATQVVQRILDILSQYAQDNELRQAQNAAVTIAQIIQDPWSDDYRKQVVTRDNANIFERAVMYSDAYRRDGGGGGYQPPYNPPHNPPYNPPHNGGQYRERLTCESYSRSQSLCRASGYIVRASLLAQRSNASCIQGRTWGTSGDSLWVSDGCRADFDVIVRR